MKIHFKIALMIVFGLLQVGSTTLGKDLKSAASIPKRREDQIVAFHEARTSARPYDSDAWRLLAGAYVQRAVVTGDGLDYDRGWEMLQKAETLDPGDPRILHARAELLLSRHHFQAARDLAEQGLAIDPENAELLAVAGDGALETGDLDAATAYYRRLKGVGARLTTWARLAHAAELRGNLDEAAEMLQKALQAGYDSGSLPEARAWCRAVLGEIELHRGNAEPLASSTRWDSKRAPIICWFWSTSRNSNSYKAIHEARKISTAESWLNGRTRRRGFAWLACFRFAEKTVKRPDCAPLPFTSINALLQAEMKDTFALWPFSS